MLTFLMRRVAMGLLLIITASALRVPWVDVWCMKIDLALRGEWYKRPDLRLLHRYPQTSHHISVRLHWLT